MNLAPNPPVAVLDTNVVLDWLVFRNPACDSLGGAIEAGAVRWLASIELRAELACVLTYPALKAWSPDLNGLWSRWDRLTQTRPRVPLEGSALRVRCTDPDDQKFIDLALGHQAQWLVSRDRAVLKAGRRARTHGLQILSPEDWAAQHRRTADGR